MTIAITIAKTGRVMKNLAMAQRSTRATALLAAGAE
jgi:hypothetical protein